MIETSQEDGGRRDIDDDYYRDDRSYSRDVDDYYDEPPRHHHHHRDRDYDYDSQEAVYQDDYRDDYYYDRRDDY